jgi:putative ABC transport system permease protein
MRCGCWRNRHLVLKEGTVPVAAGTVLGLGGSFFTLRALAAHTPIMMNKLGEVSHDLLVLFVAPLGLVGFAIVSCALPARRATKIDPMSALRAE